MPPVQNVSRQSEITGARAVAMRLLARHARHYPDLHPLLPDDQGLCARDAALAHTIVDTALRRWITLSFLLETLLKRPFEAQSPVVQSAFLAGASQLLFLDRLPTYAVVNDTVEWVKTSSGKKSAGFVNAVLRRTIDLVERDDDRPRRRPRWENRRDELPAADGGAIMLASPLLPDEPLERLAMAAGMRRSLLEYLARSHTPAEIKRFALHGVSKPPVILNTAYAQSPAPIDLLVAHSSPGHHVYRGDAAALGRLLAERDDLWVQDPASSAAVGLAAGLSPRLIIDVCAGRGTKTRQLRAMFPDARLVASDASDDRRTTLEQVFLRDDRVQVVRVETLVDWSGEADLVLLDVPCSNTGVLGRRVEARHRWSDRSVDSLVGVQRQIVADSILLLAPGGGLLYTTCSVDERENEDQIAWIQRWHSLKTVSLERRWPAGGPGEEPTESSDGAFAALVR